MYDYRLIQNKSFNPKFNLIIDRTASLTWLPRVHVPDGFLFYSETDRFYPYYFFLVQIIFAFNHSDERRKHVPTYLVLK